AHACWFWRAPAPDRCGAGVLRPRRDLLFLHFFVMALSRRPSLSNPPSSSAPWRASPQAASSMFALLLRGGPAAIEKASLPFRPLHSSEPERVASVRCLSQHGALFFSDRHPSPRRTDNAAR